MKRIMKTLGIVTIVVLLLGGGAVVPVSAVAEVTVSIDAPDEAAPDSDFTANVNVSDVVDFDACNYDISFDASVLRLDNVTSGLIGSTTIPVDVYNEISPGTYRVIHNVPGLSGASGSGYLAVLHFYVIGSAGDSSTISLSNGMLSNNLAEEIPATWVGDTVSVSDTGSPSVTITPLAPDPTKNNTQTFTGTATDTSSNISWVEYKVDEEGWIAATASDGTFDSLSEGYSFTTATLSNGAHTVYVRATDSATNTTAEANYVSDSFAVDTGPPSVTITALTPDPTNDNTPTFTGMATDTLSNVGGVEYKVDDGSWAAATASDGAFDSLSEGYTFTTAALSDGLHTVYVKATDAATNTTAEADYASDSFTVQTVIPGDASGDGNVNALDIIRVERVIVGLDTETPGADANQDGIINALDIIKIERIITGLD